MRIGYTAAIGIRNIRRELTATTGRVGEPVLGCIIGKDALDDEKLSGHHDAPYQTNDMLFLPCRGGGPSSPANDARTTCC